MRMAFQSPVYGEWQPSRLFSVLRDTCSVACPLISVLSEGFKIPESLLLKCLCQIAISNFKRSAGHVYSSSAALAGLWPAVHALGTF